MQRFAICRTDLGWIGLARTDKGICRVVLPKESEDDAVAALKQRYVDLTHDSECFAGLIERLTRYGRGELVEFNEELDLSAHTPFRQAVWALTRAIPFGETRSYGSIARELGRPGGARAVGQAMGHNPVPLIVPCHRVIASNGALQGFDGGLPMKERLLRLEKAALFGAKSVK